MRANHGTCGGPWSHRSRGKCGWCAAGLTTGFGLSQVAISPRPRRNAAPSPSSCFSIIPRARTGRSRSIRTYVATKSSSARNHTRLLAGLRLISLSRYSPPCSRLVRPGPEAADPSAAIQSTSFHLFLHLPSAEPQTASQSSLPGRAVTATIDNDNKIRTAQHTATATLLPAS